MGEQLLSVLKFLGLIPRSTYAHTKTDPYLIEFEFSTK